MIDTDNVKGGYCSKQEMIFYLNAVEEVKRLREGIKQLTVKVEGMSTGYAKPIVKALKEVIE